MSKEYAYTQNYTEGEKYQSSGSLSTTDIAKLIRKDLASAFPKKDGYAFSVITDYFSGGSSITVKVKSVPFTPYSQEYAQKVVDNGYKQRPASDWVYEMPHYRSFYNDIYKRFIDDVIRIVDSYNYSDCDGMIDYFDVNYYSSVSLSREVYSGEYNNFLFDLASTGEFTINQE